MSERILLTNRFSGMSIFKYEDDYIFAKDKSDPGMRLSKAPLGTLRSALFHMVGLEQSGEILQYFSTEEDFSDLKSKIAGLVIMGNHNYFTEVEKHLGWSEGSIIFYNEPLVISKEDDEYYFFVDEVMEERALISQIDSEEIKGLHGRFSSLKEVDGHISYCRSTLDLDDLLIHLEELIYS